MKTKLLFFAAICASQCALTMLAMETNTSPSACQNSQTSPAAQPMVERNETEIRRSIAAFGLIFVQRCGASSVFSGLTCFDFRQICDYLLKNYCPYCNCNFVNYSGDSLKEHIAAHKKDVADNCARDIRGLAANLLTFE